MAQPSGRLHADEIAMFFLALKQDKPIPLEMERAALAAVLVFLGAAGIFMLFANTRGDVESAAFFLAPALAMAACGVLTVARDDGADPRAAQAPMMQPALPYGAPGAWRASLPWVTRGVGSTSLPDGKRGSTSGGSRSAGRR